MKGGLKRTEVRGVFSFSGLPHSLPLTLFWSLNWSSIESCLQLFLVFPFILSLLHSFAYSSHSFPSFSLMAAAKELQSCLTLCNPREGSLRESSVPGILQAITLEWAAISFSNAWKWSRSVMSDSSRPHGLQPKLLCLWEFPGKSTGVGCHRIALLHWDQTSWVQALPLDSCLTLASLLAEP